MNGQVWSTPVDAAWAHVNASYLTGTALNLLDRNRPKFARSTSAASRPLTSFSGKQAMPESRRSFD